MSSVDSANRPSGWGKQTLSNARFKASFRSF
jgi:hypothetical protein